MVRRREAFAGEGEANTTGSRGEGGNRLYVGRVGLSANEGIRWDVEC